MVSSSMETTRGPAAFGRPVDSLACDNRRRSGDRDLLAVEVDVFPPQVEQLATSCSGVGRDVEEGEQPVLLCRSQESPELDDDPDGAGFLSCARGRLARSTGLLPISSSTMTASRNAFLSTACKWVTVATASGWPSRPPLVSRSR